MRVGTLLMYNKSQRNEKQEHEEDYKKENEIGTKLISNSTSSNIKRFLLIADKELKYKKICNKH